MKNPLQELVGLHVTKAELVHDYVQILFGETVALTIYNDYTIDAGKQLAQLQEQTLLDVSQNERRVVLTFESGITFNVNLLPEAYHCPEAMVLHREGQPIYVWN